MYCPPARRHRRRVWAQPFTRRMPLMRQMRHRVWGWGRFHSLSPRGPGRRGPTSAPPHALHPSVDSRPQLPPHSASLHPVTFVPQVPALPRAPCPASHARLLRTRLALLCKPRVKAGAARGARAQHRHPPPRPVFPQALLPEALPREQRPLLRAGPAGPEVRAGRGHVSGCSRGGGRGAGGRTRNLLSSLARQVGCRRRLLQVGCGVSARRVPKSHSGPDSGRVFTEWRRCRAPQRRGWGRGARGHFLCHPTLPAGHAESQAFPGTPVLVAPCPALPRCAPASPVPGAWNV